MTQGRYLGIIFMERLSALASINSKDGSVVTKLEFNISEAKEFEKSC